MDRILFPSLKKCFLFDEYYYIFSGAVASMFWVDAELGVDIYLDGKFRNEFFFKFSSKM